MVSDAMWQQKTIFRHPHSRCELKVWFDVGISCVIVSSAYIVSTANNMAALNTTEEVRYGYIYDEAAQRFARNADSFSVADA